VFFRQKEKLRKQYNQELVDQLEQLRKNWVNQSSLLERSLDPCEDAIIQTKLAELKYFYLFREAKKRKVMIQR
jgi:Protein of unknown function (DUF2508)